MYRQDPGGSNWPEQAETHPYAAEEESELGYMDDPYHEEPYEELLTPEFISSERDTLWMVEVATLSRSNLQRQAFIPPASPIRPCVDA